MANHSFQKMLSWGVTAICAIWMGLTLYGQFLAVDPDQYSFRSPEIEQKMKDCAGSYEQRYKCKEALIIEKGHNSFMIWLGKMALVFGPPAVLWNLQRLSHRRYGRENHAATFDAHPPSSGSAGGTSSIKRHKIR